MTSLQRQETSAGAVLVRQQSQQVELLLIRVRASGYELPKGHLEAGETLQMAALRELREETGVLSECRIGPEAGQLEYQFLRGRKVISKRVHYYLVVPLVDELEFGPKEERTRELRWLAAEEVETVPLVSEDLRAILRSALRLLGEQAR